MKDLPDIQLKEKLAYLRTITQQKNEWPLHYKTVSSYLQFDNVILQAKAIWMIGEMGLLYPNLISDTVLQQLLDFLEHADTLIRERALCALGRIGRGNGACIEPYIDRILGKLKDNEGSVRMNAIWACENIATSHPEFFASDINRFLPLLDDTEERTRMEAPEIFRVLGKTHSEYILPYVTKLENISQNDMNRVVRIHAAGALKAAGIYKTLL